MFIPQYCLLLPSLISFSLGCSNASRVRYPRSDAMASHLSRSAFDALAVAGDYSETPRGQLGLMRRLAKCWLEQVRFPSRVVFHRRAWNSSPIENGKVSDVELYEGISCATSTGPTVVGARAAICMQPLHNASILSLPEESDPLRMASA